MPQHDRVYENEAGYVYADSNRYYVYRHSGTYATSDSDHTLDGPGLSLAIARLDYLAKQLMSDSSEKALMSEAVPEIRERISITNHPRG